MAFERYKMQFKIAHRCSSVQKRADRVAAPVAGRGGVPSPPASLERRSRTALTRDLRDRKREKEREREREREV